MTNEELKEDYKMLIEAWINTNNMDTKVLADSLVDYANKLNKPCVSSCCCSKKIPVAKQRSFIKAWTSIKDGSHLERAIFDAGYRIGIKDYRKLNNC